VYALYVITRHLKFYYLAFGVVKVPLLDQAMAAHHDKELPFGVMPVLPFGDSGLADVDGYLPTVERVNQLGEGAALVYIHLQREGDLFFRQIGKIGAVKFLGKGPIGYFGNGEGAGLFSKGVKQVNYMTQSRLVSSGDIAVASGAVGHHLQTIEFATMLVPFQASNHLGYQVIDV